MFSRRLNLAETNREKVRRLGGQTNALSGLFYHGVFLATGGVGWRNRKDVGHQFSSFALFGWVVGMWWMNRHPQMVEDAVGRPHAADRIDFDLLLRPVLCGTTIMPLRPSTSPFEHQSEERIDKRPEQVAKVNDNRAKDERKVALEAPPALDDSPEEWAAQMSSQTCLRISRDGGESCICG